jgi:Derlin-2/3
VVLHSVIPWADILGFIVGHLYYYLEDVYPSLPQSQGLRILKTPNWFLSLLNGRPEVQVEPLPDLQMNQLDHNVQ